jgi:hypothetical protein
MYHYLPAVFLLQVECMFATLDFFLIHVAYILHLPLISRICCLALGTPYNSSFVILCLFGGPLACRVHTTFLSHAILLLVYILRLFLLVSLVHTQKVHRKDDLTRYMLYYQYASTRYL